MTPSGIQLLPPLPLLGHGLVLFHPHDLITRQEGETSTQKLCKKEEKRGIRKSKHHHSTSWREATVRFYRLTKLCLLNFPSSKGISIPSIRCRISFQSSKVVPSKILDGWTSPSANPSIKVSMTGSIIGDGGLSSPRAREEGAI